MDNHNQPERNDRIINLSDHTQRDYHNQLTSKTPVHTEQSAFEQTQQDYYNSTEQASQVTNPPPHTKRRPRRPSFQSHPAWRKASLALTLLSYAVALIGSLYLAFVLIPQAICVYQYVNAVDATSQAISAIDHGDTLQEVLENIRYEKYEFFTAFDADGNKIFEWTSNDQLHVEMPNILLIPRFLNNGHTIAHNHIYDSPFSNADLVTASHLNAQEVIVVSPNYTYTITPSENGWPKDSEIEGWFDFMRTQFSSDSEVWRYILVYNQTDGSYYKTAYCTDTLMEWFIRDFGGTYTKVPAPTASSDTIGEPAW